MPGGRGGGVRERRKRKEKRGKERREKGERRRERGEGREEKGERRRERERKEREREGREEKGERRRRSEEYLGTLSGLLEVLYSVYLVFTPGTDLHSTTLAKRSSSTLKGGEEEER